METLNLEVHGLDNETALKLSPLNTSVDDNTTISEVSVLALSKKNDILKNVEKDVSKTVYKSDKEEKQDRSVKDQLNDQKSNYSNGSSSDKNLNISTDFNLNNDNLEYVESDDQNENNRHKENIFSQSSEDDFNLPPEDNFEDMNDDEFDDFRNVIDEDDDYTNFQDFNINTEYDDNNSGLKVKKDSLESLSKIDVDVVESKPRNTDTISTFKNGSVDFETIANKENQNVFKNEKDEDDFGDFGNEKDEEDFGDFGNEKDEEDFGDFGNEKDEEDFGDFGNEKDEEDFGDFGNVKDKDDFGDFGNEKDEEDFGDFGNEKDEENFGDFGNEKDEEDFGDFGNVKDEENFGDFGNVKDEDDFGDFGNEKDDFGDFGNEKDEENFGDFGNEKDEEDFGDFGNVKDEDDFGDFGNEKDEEDFGDFGNEKDEEDFGDFGNVKDEENFGDFGNVKDEDDFGDFGNVKDEDDFGDFGNEKDEEDFGDFGNEKNNFSENLSKNSLSSNSHKTKATIELIAFEKWFPYTFKDHKNKDESQIELIYSHVENDLLKCFSVSISNSTSTKQNRPSVIWKLLKNVDDTAALKFTYEDSRQQKNLLNSLKVDSNNIVYKGSNKPYVIPTYYAASMNLLDPTTQMLKPVSAAEKIKVTTSRDHIQDDIKWSTETVATSSSKKPVKSPVNTLSPVDVECSKQREVINSLSIDFLNQFETPPSKEQDKLDPELLDLANTVSKENGKTSESVKRGDTLSKLLATIKSSGKQTVNVEEEELSSEAKTELANLPDLSYMRSGVLMFPIRLQQDFK